VSLPGRTGPHRRVLLGGRIVTMDAASPDAEALAIEGDRVLAAGTAESVLAAAGPGAERLDLDGATVVPGLIESHVHPTFFGLTRSWVDCRSPGRASIADIVAALAERARSGGGEWIQGFGYDDTLLADQRHPGRADLDRASAQVPIVITHISGHFAVANSAALARAGVTRDTADPEDGRFVRDGSGQPTGLLWELGAVRHVTTRVPPPSPADLRDATIDALRYAVAHGITTVHDMAAGIHGGPGVLGIYRELAGESRLPVRVRGFLSGELLDDYLAGDGPAADGPAADGAAGGSADWFRLTGVKYWADGSIQGLSAALTEPYSCRDDSTGELNYTQDRFRAMVSRAHRAGFQVAIHTNGDRAVDAALDALSSAMAAHPRPGPRHRLEHVQVVHPRQLDRMRDLGINASFFINHVYFWGDRHRDRFLGASRAAAMDPLATAARAGLRFGLHSDCPITPMDPLLTWWAAVNRRTSGGAELGPDERIGVWAALAALTRDAAYLTGDEHRLGSLRAGSLADLVVLDGDPAADDGARIRSLPVRQVMVGGRFAE